MKLQIGAGSRPLEGFINIDNEAVSDRVRYGEAIDLSFIEDLSVDIIFTNAVFEHFFPQEHQGILNEWKRVLAEQGAIICLGIPDFGMISRLYGVLRLGTIARYVQGEISYDAPSIPQFHKFLFDMETLYDIFKEAELVSHVFRYKYPQELYALNLGVVASKKDVDVIKALSSVSSIDEYIDLDSIKYKFKDFKTVGEDSSTIQIAQNRQ